MIPKNCLLTDKGKLLATLNGTCTIYTPTICKLCPYRKPKYRSITNPFADYIMDEWGRALLEETKQIKIE
jgi:hypothetical protein